MITASVAPNLSSCVRLQAAAAKCTFRTKLYKRAKDPLDHASEFGWFAHYEQL